MTIAVVLSTSSLVVTQQVHHPGFITTVAGSGRAGHGGDGGLATEASFNNVAMVIQTKNGDLFISDPNTHVVRKVTNSSGIITTFAGRPSLSGSSGDGGLATSARLNYPWGLYYNETSGSLYIVDTQNHRVRRVDPNGKISTVAGWSAGYSGDGGLAIDAQLYTPYEIIGNDKGELFIADMGNNRIRKIGVDKKISTIAGDGTNGDFKEGEEATKSPLAKPFSLAFNDAGELFFINRNIADAFFVLKIGLDGRLQRVAGSGVKGFSGDGGPAVDASFKYVWGMALGKEGEVYIADTENYRVRMVNSEGVISTIAGTGPGVHYGDGGPAKEATLGGPRGLSVGPNGDLFVADFTRVRMIYASWSCFGLTVDDQDVCSGHGECISRNNCTCHEGYTGESCSDLIFTCYNISSTNETVCSGHGVCNDTDSCTCDEGYTGKNCSEVIVKCYGVEAGDLNVCSGHGTCTSHDNCTCNEAYTGKSCSEPIIKCFGIESTETNVCSGHGKCASEDKCTCHEGYTGEKCSDKTIPNHARKFESSRFLPVVLLIFALVFLP